MKAKNRMSSNRVEVLLRLKPHSVKDLIEKGIPLPRMYFADLIIKAIIASSTFILDPSSKYNLLGDREAAILDTFNLA